MYLKTYPQFMAEQEAYQSGIYDLTIKNTYLYMHRKIFGVIYTQVLTVIPSDEQR